MKVIIAGSREGVSYLDTLRAIKAFIERHGEISEVVSGTARGADQYGEAWARSCGIPVKRFPANWDEEGKQAGYRRNVRMALYADGCIVVHNGFSRGSKHMLKIAQERKMPTIYWDVTKDYA